MTHLQAKGQSRLELKPSLCCSPPQSYFPHRGFRERSLVNWILYRVFGNRKALLVCNRRCLPQSPSCPSLGSNLARTQPQTHLGPSSSNQIWLVIFYYLQNLTVLEPKCPKVSAELQIRPGLFGCFYLLTSRWQQKTPSPMKLLSGWSSQGALGHSSVGSPA